MSYKAIYTYAWDLAETGVAAAAKEFRDLGLDTVTIAGSYHAGKFMRPHGKAGKVYFPEDGTVYFNADPSRYGAIKPVANGLLGERDVLRELADDERHGRQCLAGAAAQHAARHGASDAVVRNAFGDPYYLQPLPLGARGARLCRRPRAATSPRATRSRGISVEAPGFTPYAHGFHHEFALMKSNRVAREHARPLLLRALPRRRGEGRHRCAPLQGGGRGRHRRLSRQRHRLSRRHGRGLLARRHRGRRRPAPLSRFPQRRRHLAGRRDPRRRPQGRRRRGDPLGGAADRRRLVRGQRPRGARRDRRHHRGLLLRAERHAGEGRPVRHQAAAARARASCAASCARRIPDLRPRASSSPRSRRLRDGGVDELAFYNWGHLRRANLAWIGDAMRGAA